MGMQPVLRKTTGTHETDGWTKVIMMTIKYNGMAFKNPEIYFLSFCSFIYVMFTHYFNNLLLVTFLCI